MCLFCFSDLCCSDALFCFMVYQFLCVMVYVFVLGVMMCGSVFLCLVSVFVVLL